MKKIIFFALGLFLTSVLGGIYCNAEIDGFPSHSVDFGSSYYKELRSCDNIKCVRQISDDYESKLSYAKMLFIALDVFRNYKTVEILKYFIEDKKVAMNARDFDDTILHKLNSAKTMEYFLEKYKERYGETKLKWFVNLRDLATDTRLGHSVNFLRDDEVELLLKYGADANKNSEYPKIFPLHRLAERYISNPKKATAIADMLIKHNADIYALDYEYNTPLHRAVENFDYSVSMALVNACLEQSNYDFDVLREYSEIKNRDDKSAIDIIENKLEEAEKYKSIFKELYKKKKSFRNYIIGVYNLSKNPEKAGKILKNTAVILDKFGLANEQAMQDLQNY